MCDEDEIIVELEEDADLTEEEMENAQDAEEILTTYRGYHQIGAGHGVDLRLSFDGTIEDIYSTVTQLADKAFAGLEAMAKMDEQIRCNIQIQSMDFGSVFSLEKGGTVADYPDVMVEMAKKLEMITESEVVIPMIDDEDYDEEEVCEECSLTDAGCKEK